jgi:hypothetical protein
MPTTLPTVPTRPHLLNQPDTLLPELIESLRANVQDPVLQQLTQRLAIQPALLVSKYDAIPPARKRVLFGAGVAAVQPIAAGQIGPALSRAVNARSKAIVNARIEQRRLVGAAYKRFKPLSVSELSAVQPGSAAEATALRIVLADKQGNDGCCPETTPPPAQNPPAVVRYGLKVNRLHCHAQEDWLGEDEPYFVAVAVDGKGNVVARQSNQWNMDSGDTRHPNWYIYPPADCGGFLDVAVALYENDGGYARVGAAVAAIGATVAQAGVQIANPWVAIAGGIISIGGEVVSIVDALDDDDDLGAATLTFRTPEELRASVGAFDRRFTGDDANYAATFELLAV